MKKAYKYRIWLETKRGMASAPNTSSPDRSGWGYGSGCHLRALSVLSGQPGWKVFSVTEIEVFPSQIRVVSFIFVVTWGCIQWQQDRSVTSISFCFLGMFQRQWKTCKSKAGRGSFAFIWLLSVKCKNLISKVVSFIFIPGFCFPTVDLIWGWWDV